MGICKLEKMCCKCLNGNKCFEILDVQKGFGSYIMGAKTGEKSLLAFNCKHFGEEAIPTLTTMTPRLYIINDGTGYIYIWTRCPFTVLHNQPLSRPLTVTLLLTMEIKKRSEDEICWRYSGLRCRSLSI